MQISSEVMKRRRWRSEVTVETVGPIFNDHLPWKMAKDQTVFPREGEIR